MESKPWLTFGISPKTQSPPRLQCWISCRTNMTSFVVAGTNKTQKDSRIKPKRIGAPADSINSLVVNATSILKEPASYTREGPVLNFFRKPDIPASEVTTLSRWPYGHHKACLDSWNIVRSPLDYTKNGISDICDAFLARDSEGHAH